jgi:hypothetical protein
MWCCTGPLVAAAAEWQCCTQGLAVAQPVVGSGVTGAGGCYASGFADTVCRLCSFLTTTCTCYQLSVKRSYWLVVTCFPLCIVLQDWNTPGKMWCDGPRQAAVFKACLLTNRRFCFTCT